MFDTDSRYFNLETATYTAADGSVTAYKKRRFLPQGSAIPALAFVSTAQGDRLDIITARTLGDPLQFWRICDANDAMNPSDLTDETGIRIKVPVPQF